MNFLESTFGQQHPKEKQETIFTVTQCEKLFEVIKDFFERVTVRQVPAVRCSREFGVVAVLVVLEDPRVQVHAATEVSDRLLVVALDLRTNKTLEKEALLKFRKLRFQFFFDVHKCTLNLTDQLSSRPTAFNCL